MSNQHGITNGVDAVMDQSIAVLHVNDQRQGVGFVQPVPMDAYAFCCRQFHIDALVLKVDLVVPGVGHFVLV